MTIANVALQKAQAELDEKQAELDMVQAQYEKALMEKQVFVSKFITRKTKCLSAYFPQTF